MQAIPSHESVTLDDLPEEDETWIEIGMKPLPGVEPTAIDPDEPPDL